MEYKLVNGEQVPLTQADLDQRAIDEAKHQARLEEQAKIQYQLDRADEYPPIGDQLDAILKHLNYMQMRGETNLIKELDGVVGRWLAVKQKYPKPPEEAK